MKYWRCYNPRSFGLSLRNVVYDLLGSLSLADRDFIRFYDEPPNAEEYVSYDGDGTSFWLARADDWSFVIDLDTNTRYDTPKLAKMFLELSGKGIAYFKRNWKDDSFIVYLSSGADIVYSPPWV